MSISFKRLRTQFESSTKLRDLIDGIFGEVQDLSGVTDRVRTETDLVNAIGVQQDRNGLDLGIDRSGLSDVDYKELQDIKVRVNNAAGIHDRILGIVEDLALLFTKDSSPPDPIPTTIVRNFPAGFRVEVTTTIKDAFVKIVGELLRKARGPGIGANIVHGGEDDGSNRFKYDTGGQGYDAGGKYTGVI